MLVDMDPPISMWGRALAFMKRLLVFIVLCFCRRPLQNRFIRHVTRHCEKRRRQFTISGLPCRLDEIRTLPDGYTDDLEFLGFNSEGCWLSLRQTRVVGDEMQHEVIVEIPGVGRFKHERVMADEATRGAAMTLRMDMPMRHWRVQFNGRMEQVAAGGGGDTVHGTVCLYWQCTNDPFSHRSTCSLWQLAKDVTQLNHEVNWSQILSRGYVWYEQWGELRGRVHIEGHTPCSVRLKSAKTREIRSDCGTECGDRVCTFLVDGEIGRRFMYGLETSGMATTKFGFVTHPISENIPADVSGKLKSDALDGTSSTTLTISNRQYEFKLKHRKVPFLDVTNRSLAMVIYDVNGTSCYGMERSQTVGVTRKSREVGHMTVKSITPFSGSDNNVLVLSLSDPKCTSRTLCGGKGASLALLSQSGFSVPDATCLTVNAFERHVASLPKLQEAISNIHARVLHYEMADLQSACINAVNICTETDIGDNIKDVIRKSLLHQVSGDLESAMFAVRSSAVSEDGGEMSTAGQMETYLGVRGLDNIYTAVAKCWASSLAFRVVEYRRQGGQPLTEPMAVVIQHMVNAQQAGVLFTNDTLTGNSCVMVLTATPGLGESLVSGAVTPDTIRVRRHRDGLDIVDTTLGDRLLKLVVDPEGGVREIAMDVGDVATPTLTRQHTLDICEVGLEIEQLFHGPPQDVEWAIFEETIYILQARDITAIELETDEELAHAIDTPVTCDRMCITSGNAGEAASGAITPLTGDILTNVDWATKFAHELGSGGTFPRIPLVTIMSFASHAFLNITALTLGSLLVLGSKTDIELAFMGRIVKDHANDVVLECFGKEPISMVKRVARFLWANIVTKWCMHNHESFGRRCDSFSFDDSLSLTGLCERIEEDVELLDKAWVGYVFMVIECSKWSGAIMAVLKGDRQFDELPMSIQSDLALLLSDCPDVISADVPKALETLAETISISNVKEEFLKTPVDKCHDILINGSCPDTKRQYVRFLKLHGHRCIQEYDLAVKSWGMVPETLMKILKHIIQEKTFARKKKNALTLDEAVERIQNKVSPVKTLLLRKLLVPWARNSVSIREAGKSVIVKVGDLVKRGYWKLAEKLVQQGYLPDERLLFYMFHSEIRELIATRSAALVRRAKRRMKVSRLQQATEYPVINAGTPVPMEVTKPELPASLTLTGLPVSLGEVQARARVIETVDDAGSIHEGEILVCPFTDIGWSPYFPLVAGLVTEVGGLASHGAIIAREYGIPCIVGVRGATKMFTSGDTIIVNAGEGTVKLVK